MNSGIQATETLAQGGPGRVIVWGSGLCTGLCQGGAVLASRFQGSMVGGTVRFCFLAALMKLGAKESIGIDSET